jgi:hypothetical protein
MLTKLQSNLPRASASLYIVVSTSRDHQHIFSCVAVHASHEYATWNDYTCCVHAPIYEMCRCQLVSTDDGDVPVCKGDVAVGEVCNDYSDCSIDDRCVAITPHFTFDTGARCRGSLISNQTCNDYNDCTDGDVCAEIPCESCAFGSFFGCRGELLAGQPCNDYVDCTRDDVCRESPLDGEAICRGTPFSGGTCNDYNQCTDPDYCVLVPELDTSFCLGTSRVGEPCDDGDPCTGGDTCAIEATSSDGIFVDNRCRGTPVSGVACDDFQECTTGDVCVFSEYGDVSFCSGTPAAGGPCNDFDPCTAGDTCVLGESGDYAFCEGGTPTPNELCDDYNEFTINDYCRPQADGSAFCIGDFVFPGPAAA